MQLSAIAAALGRRMGQLDADCAANPTVPAVIDIEPALPLMVRAMRWITALVARIVAEREAALGAPVRADRQDAPAAPRRPRATAREARLWYEAGIGDRPTAEVIGQICADLSAAATLLQIPALVRQIAEIAAAARALLGGPGAAWKPLPSIRPGCHAAAGAVADMIAAVTPVPAPDTG